MPSPKKKSTKPARARSVQSQRVAAKGPRTLVHASLPQELVEGVDTLLWMRVTGAAKDVEEIRGGKYRIYDEAVTEFLHRFEHKPCKDLTVRSAARGWTTLWVSTPLVDRLKMVALREDVAIGRLACIALTRFIEGIVKPDWRAFRQEATARAQSLLGSKS